MEDIKALLEKIDAEAQKQKAKIADKIKTAMNVKRDEIKVLQKEYDELADAYSEATGKARKAKGGAAGGRKARTPSARIEELVGKMKTELSKGKDYNAAEVADALGATADEFKSAMSKAKANGVLVSNGKVGKAGRVRLG